MHIFYCSKHTCKRGWAGNWLLVYSIVIALVAVICTALGRKIAHIQCSYTFPLIITAPYFQYIIFLKCTFFRGSKLKKGFQIASLVKSCRENDLSFPKQFYSYWNKIHTRCFSLYNNICYCVINFRFITLFKFN